MKVNTTQITQKPHFSILDGLRGVAALLVVAFHLFEIHQTSSHDQIINHGYLAVDFFFLLSGFVIGYAYDDRWTKMSVGQFLKRRVIRLQPMAIVGSIIGVVCFYYGSGDFFHLISKTSIAMLLLVGLLGCFMIPITPSMDVRMWGEMYPLNGPAWSLFYEYIANILYALFVRHFSKLWLTILVIASGATLTYYTVFCSEGQIIGGHVLDAKNLGIGMTRLIYPFFCGLLLFKMGKMIKIKGSFLICSIILVALLAMPRIGGDQLWINGLYESILIIAIFPLIVLTGAGSAIKGAFARKLCDFLGKISFPLYIIHYPIVYIYMAYVMEHNLTWHQTWPLMLTLWAANIVLAYACLKLIDEPIRRWLTKRTSK